MVRVDRLVRARLNPKSPIVRNRFQAIAAGAAIAFIAGLSAPGFATTATGSSSAGGLAEVASVASGTDQAGTPSEAGRTGAKANAAAKPAGKPAPDAGSSAPKAAPAAPKAPSAGQLHPNGVPGGQSRISPSPEQVRNARAIIAAGKKLGLPPRAWVIAIATSLQESKLRNLGNLGAANDHDSLGLFQQRPSSGWGTPEQIRDPAYAARKFYQGLAGVGGWKTMELTDAAQAVQVSAFPDAYAQWEKMAADLVTAEYGSGPYAGLSATVK